MAWEEFEEKKKEIIRNKSIEFSLSLLGLIKNGPFSPTRIADEEKRLRKLKIEIQKIKDQSILSRTFNRNIFDSLESCLSEIDSNINRYSNGVVDKKSIRGRSRYPQKIRRWIISAIDMARTPEHYNILFDFLTGGDFHDWIWSISKGAFAGPRIRVKDEEIDASYIYKWLQDFKQTQKRDRKKAK